MADSAERAKLDAEAAVPVQVAAQLAEQVEARVSEKVEAAREAVELRVRRQLEAAADGSSSRMQVGQARSPPLRTNLDARDCI